MAALKLGFPWISVVECLKRSLIKKKLMTLTEDDAGKLLEAVESRGRMPRRMVSIGGNGNERRKHQSDGKQASGADRHERNSPG